MKRFALSRSKAATKLNISSLYSRRSDITLLFHKLFAISPQTDSSSKKDVPGVFYSEDWQKCSFQKKNGLKILLFLLFLISIVMKN